MTQRDEREKMLALADDIEDQAGRDIILHQPDRDLIIAALRTPTDGEAQAEIQRLQDAKRRALAIADERAKENVALRDALVKSRQWVDANTAQVRGLSREAAAPGEAMLAEIDAALSRDPADTIEPDQGEDYFGERSPQVTEVPHE